MYAFSISCGSFIPIVVAKTTAAQNEVALRYYRVRGLYFLAVFVTTTIIQFNFSRNAR